MTQLSDLYVFRVPGEDSLFSVRLLGVKDNTWLSTDLVLASTRVHGWTQLLFLCGRDPYTGDRRSIRPSEVRQIWESYNPGVLRECSSADVARKLVSAGLIREVELDENGLLIHNVKDAKKES